MGSIGDLKDRLVDDRPFLLRLGHLLTFAQREGQSYPLVGDLGLSGSVGLQLGSQFVGFWGEEP